VRALILPSAAWLGILQAFVPPSPSGFYAVSTVSGLVATAIAFGTLTVMIYRLGVWHQVMASTKDNVSAGIERIERHLEAIDHALTMLIEYRQELEKWQSLIERRLHRLETEDGA
jgi:hypothetical protein